MLILAKVMAGWRSAFLLNSISYSITFHYYLLLMFVKIYLLKHFLNNHIHTCQFLGVNFKNYRAIFLAYQQLRPKESIFHSNTVTKKLLIGCPRIIRSFIYTFIQNYKEVSKIVYFLDFLNSDTVNLCERINYFI
jgi:hypothetical protein